jgi:hypothetical protein
MKEIDGQDHIMGAMAKLGYHFLLEAPHAC